MFRDWIFPNSRRCMFCSPKGLHWAPSAVTMSAGMFLQFIRQPVGNSDQLPVRSALQCLQGPSTLHLKNKKAALRLLVRSEVKGHSTPTKGNSLLRRMFSFKLLLSIYMIWRIKLRFVLQLFFLSLPSFLPSFLSKVVSIYCFQLWHFH